MDPSFSVFDVLRIAEEVEHRAALYYLKVAQGFPDMQRRRICYDLASWRLRHRQRWSRMRQGYSEKTGEFGRFDPDNYVSSNPQVMAGLTWFGADADSGHRLFGQESERQILRDALRQANGVLIFCHGLKDFACDTASSMMIDNIIVEEDRHIRLLARSLEGMQVPDASPTHLGALLVTV
jgi:rubrerythrin